MRLLLIISILTIKSVFANVDVHYIRSRFKYALHSSNETNHLLEELGPQKIENPILNGYKGALLALKAKHAFNPITKLSYLNQGVDLLNTTIKFNPANAELRLLRFNLELNIPEVLGFTKHTSEDARHLYQYVLGTSANKDNQELLLAVSQALIHSKIITQQQLTFLQQKIVQCKP